MARINARSKGASGERELCEWLELAFNLAEKPTRNLEQVRSGGVDVIVAPFAFECKRVEKLDLLAWWSQAVMAVSDETGIAFGYEPVVAFRQNKCDWGFLISGRFIGLENGYIRLSKAAFKKWVPVYIKMNFGSNRIYNPGEVDFILQDKNLKLSG